MHISPMISSLSRGETSLLQRGRRFPWTKIGCTNQANFTTTKRTNLGTLTQPQRPQIKNIFPTQAIPASARFFAAMLSPADREKAVSKLQSWQDVSDRNAISKRFEFKNFQQAWSFMSDVAKVAEEMGHHPEWSNTYNTVAVTLTTHDCNGVSQKVNVLSFFIIYECFFFSATSLQVWQRSSVIYLQKLTCLHLTFCFDRI